MPDAQGVSSVVGEFLKGYMGQTAQEEQKKVEKVRGILDIADRYRRIAEDPDASDVEYNHAQEQYQTFLGMADKEFNRSTSGLGSIMKIFGFGKKGKNGTTPSMPRQWFQKPPEKGAPTVAAAMPRPGFMGPEPTIPREEDMPAEFRGIPRQMYASVPGTAAPAPIAPVANPAPPDQYAGMSPRLVRRAQFADIQADKNQQRQIEAAKQTAEINKQNQQDVYNWQQQQRQALIKDQLDAYRARPEYGTDPEADRRMEDYIQFGIQPRQESLRTKTEIVRNEANQLVRRTTDLRNGETISEDPYANANDEPLIQAIIENHRAKGETVTPDQALAELGQVRLRGLTLTNTGKEAGIQAQAALTKSRQQRTQFLKDKENNGGTLTPSQAASLYKAAKASAISRFKAEVSEMDQLQMNQATKNAMIARFEKEYVEGGSGQEGIMAWDEMIKLVNPNAAPPKTPEEKAKAFIQSMVGAQKNNPSAPATIRPGNLPK
jgi:hypothetical protein